MIAMLATVSFGKDELVIKLKDLLKEHQETFACSRAQIDYLDSQLRIFKLIELARP